MACNPDYYFLQLTSILRQTEFGEQENYKKNTQANYISDLSIYRVRTADNTQFVFVRPLTTQETNYILTSSMTNASYLVNVDRNRQFPRHLLDYLNVKYDVGRNRYKMAVRLNTIDLRKSTRRLYHSGANTYFYAQTLGGRKNHRQVAKIAS
jgi:hypothetical protein